MNLHPEEPNGNVLCRKWKWRSDVVPRWRLKHTTLVKFWWSPLWVCDVMGQASERLVSCLGVSVALFVDGRHACMTQSAAALPGHNGRRRAGAAGRAGEPTDGRLNACDGRRVISLSWRPWWRSLAAATITISCRTECLPAVRAWPLQWWWPGGVAGLVCWIISCSRAATMTPITAYNLSDRLARLRSVLPLLFTLLSARLTAESPCPLLSLFCRVSFLSFCSTSNWKNKTSVSKRKRKK